MRYLLLLIQGDDFEGENISYCLVSYSQLIFPYGDLSEREISLYGDGLALYKVQGSAHKVLVIGSEVFLYLKEIKRVEIRSILHRQNIGRVVAIEDHQFLAENASYKSLVSGDQKVEVQVVEHEGQLHHIIVCDLSSTGDFVRLENSFLVVLG